MNGVILIHSDLISVIPPMMDEVCTSETSVYSETTGRYIPESYELLTRRYESLR
jgi:hypothetical protein